MRLSKIYSQNCKISGERKKVKMDSTENSEISLKKKSRRKKRSKGRQEERKDQQENGLK